MRKAFESLLFTSLARDSTCSYPSLQCTVQVRNPETRKQTNKLQSHKLKCVNLVNPPHLAHLYSGVVESQKRIQCSERII